MRILWLKSDLLLPLDKGGRLRTWHLMRHLARRHEITYLAFSDPDASPADVARMCEVATRVETVPRPDPAKQSWRFYADVARHLADSLPYAVAKYRSPAFAERVRELLADGSFDLLVCDFLFPAVNLPRALPCPAVIFTHNVESEIWRRHAETKTGASKLLYWLQYRRMLKYEARTLARFDGVLAVSLADRETFARLYPGAVRAPIHVVSTGVETDYFTPGDDARLKPCATDVTPPEGARLKPCATSVAQPPSQGFGEPRRSSLDQSASGGGDFSPAQSRSLVFTGSMDWLPNVDAMQYFCRDVLPLIRAEEPDVTLSIVGRAPTPDVVRLGAQPGITVTGRVDDVRPYVRDAAVYVVPLRIGGGTRLKIFEAMAMAKAVVSTGVGAEGLPITHGEHVMLADEPRTFARAVIRMFRDIDRRRRLEAAARALVVARYDWSAVAGELDDALVEVSRGRIEHAAAGATAVTEKLAAPQGVT